MTISGYKDKHGLCRFDTSDHRLYRSEALSRHRAKSLFDSPMVLFDDMVQVLGGPYQHAPHCAEHCGSTKAFRFQVSQMQHIHL